MKIRAAVLSAIGAKPPYAKTRPRSVEDRLMSERLTLDQINEGFDRLHEGKTVRQVITF